MSKNIEICQQHWINIYFLSRKEKKEIYKKGHRDLFQ